MFKPRQMNLGYILRRGQLDPTSFPSEFAQILSYFNEKLSYIRKNEIVKQMNIW